MHKTFANDGVTSIPKGLAAVTYRYVEFIRMNPAFRVLWYSPEFANPHRIVLDVEDHALANLFLDVAYQYGLVERSGPQITHSMLASWLALDAVIDAAFRLDSDGDEGMLAHAGRIAAAMNIPLAA